VTTGIFLKRDGRPSPQIFLDQAEASLEAEQQEILRRIRRLGPYLKGFGVASALVLVLILGLWLYPALKEFFRT
jgi:hypothetical protein